MPWKPAGFALLLAAAAAAQTPDRPLSSGLELANFDRTVRPQDDLFRFVNGGWLARTPIPGDRVWYGTFTELSDRVESDLRAIVESTIAAHDRSPAARQVADLYASLMDVEGIEARGLAPVRPQLQRIDGDSHRQGSRARNRLPVGDRRRRSVPGIGRGRSDPSRPTGRPDRARRHPASRSRLLLEERAEVRRPARRLRGISRAALHAGRTQRSRGRRARRRRARNRHRGDPVDAGADARGRQRRPRLPARRARARDARLRLECLGAAAGHRPRRRGRPGPARVLQIVCRAGGANADRLRGRPGSKRATSPRARRTCRARSTISASSSSAAISRDRSCRGRTGSAASASSTASSATRSAVSTSRST